MAMRLGNIRIGAILGVTAGLLGLAHISSASVIIGFEGIATGVFSGPASEAGVTISASLGTPYVDDFNGVFGNPGNGIFNDATSGISVFVFDLPAPVEFLSIDIVGGLLSGGSGSVRVDGYLSGALQTSDTFAPGGTYSTFNAVNLSGVTVDRVDVVMPDFGVAADNVTFAPVAIPEPSSMALLLAAGISFAGYRRRR